MLARGVPRTDLAKVIGSVSGARNAPLRPMVRASKGDPT